MQSFFGLQLHADETNGQYNEKWPISLVYKSKLLTTAITAIISFIRFTESLSNLIYNTTNNNKLY